MPKIFERIYSLDQQILQAKREAFVLKPLVDLFPHYLRALDELQRAGVKDRSPAASAKLSRMMREVSDIQG